MGNSGSHFLGFILGAIALLISYASMGRKTALLTPLLILGFPIIDTTIIVLLRLGKGIIPFKKSNDHLALKLLSLGYSKNKVLMIAFSWCLFFAICGVLLSKVSSLLGMFIITFTRL